jgi:ribosomal protein S18 acetylase RimI-like enzyme
MPHVDEIACVIRPAQTHDLDQIVAIDAICFVAGIAYSRRELAALLASRSTVSRVAAQGNTIMGFAILQLLRFQREVYGELITIDVLPQYREAGVGQQLHHALEQVLAGMDAVCLQLHVSVENLPAIHFYRQLGYRTLARVPLYYLETVDAWQMEKTLVKHP